MTLMEDYRKKKDGDDADFLAGEEKDDDEAALREKGKNSLDAEEKIEVDTGGDD